LFRIGCVVPIEYSFIVENVIRHVQYDRLSPSEYPKSTTQ
jgi:hypothetical protein